MEKGNRIILTDENEIGIIVENAVKRVISIHKQENNAFENDKISKAETAKLINRSLPYVNKLIKSGILKDYGFGKRGKYLLKNEVLEALRNSNL